MLQKNALGSRFFHPPYPLQRGTGASNDSYYEISNILTSNLRLLIGNITVILS